MIYRILGASGIKASAVGLGTWAIGGWMWGGVDESSAERAIQVALDEGVTLIDTAPAYGFGRSEEIVGRAIAGRRDKVVLATKCGLVWTRQEGQFFFNSDEQGISPTGSHKIYRLLSPASIREEVEASLKRLKTDRLDLYQTHWQEGTTPIGDTMTELLRLRAEGKIRAIGVCNATMAQMDEYRALGPLDSDQEKFSMLDRQIEHDQLPYCRNHEIALLAYSPLALGLLSGKTSGGRKYGEGDLRQDNPRFTSENITKVSEFLARLRPLAEQRGITLAQLVIGWTLAQHGITHVLVGARNPDQARENAGAGRVELTAQELAEIDHALARHALS